MCDREKKRDRKSFWITKNTMIYIFPYHVCNIPDVFFFIQSLFRIERIVCTAIHSLTANSVKKKRCSPANNKFPANMSWKSSSSSLSLSCWKNNPIPHSLHFDICVFRCFCVKKAIVVSNVQSWIWSDTLLSEAISLKNHFLNISHTFRVTILWICSCSNKSKFAKFFSFDFISVQD